MRVQLYFLAAFGLIVTGDVTRSRPATAADRMQVTIDARELPRKLLHSQVDLPLSPKSKPSQLALWYPKWVPGSHGPGGAVENLAGLRIENAAGEVLSWKRTPGEVYRLEVSLPAKTDRIRIHLRYITNQPSVNSMGHDSWGSAKIGIISPNTILLYPETSDVRTTEVSSELLLPKGWKVASALQQISDRTDAASIQYQPVSLERFVDSPLMCGPYHQVVDLVTADRAESIPPHRLQLFHDEPSTEPIHPEIIEKLRAMVTETALLTGAHPFDQFDILLALTDALPANGLEHARSTLNVLSPKAVAKPSAFTGWNRLLIPHEYLHAWCGKYRRPAGMVSGSFHEPKDTELLWVYEGLTQYLGEIVEARCGLMTNSQFLDRLVVELRSASYQQGRKWRTLADTGAASHILRARSDSWPSLRRSQDYYMEGMLFWLEADAIVRSKTGGKKSLDDFCQQFFRVEAKSPHPNPFTRDEVVRILNSLVKFDWDGLIRRRVESFQSEFDPGVATLLGYRFVVQDTIVAVPADTFRNPTGVDMRASLGASFSAEGVIRDLLLNSPADIARLQPDMRIIAIGDRKWSARNLQQAIIDAEAGKPIDLHVFASEEFRTIQVHYYAGPRSLNLVRDETQPDLLEPILKPRSQ